MGSTLSWGGAGGGDTPEQRMREVTRTIRRSLASNESSARRIQDLREQARVDLRQLARKQDANREMRNKAVFIRRTSQWIDKLDKQRLAFETMLVDLEGARAINDMQGALAKVTTAMANINRTMSNAQLMKIAQNYERISSQLETRNEMVDDALESANAGGGDGGGEVDEETEIDSLVQAAIDTARLEADAVTTVPDHAPAVVVAAVTSPTRPSTVRLAAAAATPSSAATATSLLSPPFIPTLPTVSAKPPGTSERKRRPS